jgi:hypothetical protein
MSENKQFVEVVISASKLLFQTKKKVIFVSQQFVLHAVCAK